MHALAKFAANKNHLLPPYNSALSNNTVQVLPQITLAHAPHILEEA